MQYALVILDGASGDPIPEWGNKTSFEVSITPCLDYLSQHGTVGLMQNVPAHMASGSDVACMSLMGYDPAEYHIGRGAIEGAALGIDLHPAQVAFRMNLCHVENNIMKSYSTDNISTEEGNALASEIKEALDDNVFTLHPGTSFRQIVVVNGFPECVDLSYETPHDNTGLDISQAYIPKATTAEQQDIADMLVAYMKSANAILAQSKVNKRRVEKGLPPASFSWLFWPGMKPGSMKPFKEIYGKTVSLNSAVDLLHGLALMTGMKQYTFKGVTDGPNNDYVSQGRGGIHMLEDGNDVVFIHVESPDAAGHDGRPDEKQHAIEQIDQHVMAPLIEYAKTHELRIAAMPDHPTPLTTKKHSHDPVPFVLTGPGIAYNGARRLTENEAKRTGLLLTEGHRFIQDMLLA